MTSSDSVVPPELYDEVAAATARVARRLVVRYAPVFAALAVLFMVAVAVPSRVGRQQSRGASGVSAATVDRGTESSSASLPAPLSVATTPIDVGSQPVSGDVLAPPAGDLAAPEPPRSNTGGGTGGFAPAASACPIAFGKDPQISRGVAGVLLSAASPALSLLGPFGPNAVPALAVASPLLPIIAPAADAFGSYIRLFNPLFLQVSQGATQLWNGPLAPLQSPLLQLNAQYAQPFEVELLARLSPPIEKVNATPVTPCVARLVYNVVAPLPIPKAPTP